MIHDPRAAYLANTVATASPARLLIMLCDRLAIDVQRAHEAQLGGDHATARLQLLHAQDIVAELRSSLDTEAWDGAPNLAALYDWLFVALVRANTTRDPELTQSCLNVASELADTWRQAALGMTRAS
ncbi:MAG: flagellar export chaperone FliS [Candidatus Nanopelagicales bacterium]